MANYGLRGGVPMPKSRGEYQTSMIAAPANQDDRFAREYHCATCHIRWTQPSRERASCPLCDSQNRLHQTQTALKAKLDEMAILKQQYQRVLEQVDLMSAMRAAAETLGAEDRAFIKGFLYQYREDKASVALRVVHGKPRKKKEAPTPTGFLIQEREGPIDAYECTSVGGRAVAGYLDEAMRTVGPPQAMAMFIKALHPLLTPGD